jgi:hypothetical protein
MLNPTPTAALARCALETLAGLPQQGRSVPRDPGAAQAVGAGPDPLPPLRVLPEGVGGARGERADRSFRS